MLEHQSTELATELGAMALAVPAPDGSAIHEVRDERVMLDADLAALFGVPTRVFNQAFKRNRERFPASWAFELTADELDDLRSQNVISSLSGANWGGRRYLPWAFTEHGVVLAASLLNSDRAKAVMQLVVEVFVQARRGQLGGNALAQRASKPVIAASRPGINHRLQSMIERLMESLISQDDQRSLREEAQAVFRESIDHIRAKLGRAGFENEEIAARATKLLAEAEATKATAVKTRAEADDIAVRTLARKLTMVLEADRAIARGEMEGFLEVLKELGKP